MKKLAMTVYGVLFLFFTACNGSNENNLIQFINSEEDLSTLANIIAYIDLNIDQNSQENIVELISNPQRDLTVFTPTNEAFDFLDQNQDGVFDVLDLESLENVLGTEELANVLYNTITNHIIEDFIVSSDFLNNQSLVTLAETQTDNFNLYGLSVDLNDGIVIVPSYTLSAGLVVFADNQVSNGVIHFIDRVLLDDDFANELNLPTDRLIANKQTNK